MTGPLAQHPVEDAPPPLRGHHHLLDRMATNLSESRLHHAWLINGPEGIGKFKTALHIAAWLLSLPKPSENGLFTDDAASLSLLHPKHLDFNHPDARLAFTQTHPDMLILAPIEDDKNKSGQIKTDQIRELNSFFAHSAGRGGWRVAIINSLDLVNRNGQNAMLKILEEPPQLSVLLVLSHQQGSILPTIRSRCTYAALHRLEEKDTQSVLQCIWPTGDEKYIGLLTRLCDGAPGQALRLAEAEAIPLFEASCRLLADDSTRRQDLWAIAEKWGSGGRKGRAVRMAGLYLFEALISQATLTSAGASGHESQFERVSFTKSAIKVLARRHNAKTLANIHLQFCAEIRQAERLFLDFIPIFARFLCELHSQTRPE